MKFRVVKFLVICFLGTSQTTVPSLTTPGAKSSFDYGVCNQYYNKRLWHLAIKCYNEGILKAPPPKPTAATYFNLIGVAYHEMHMLEDAKGFYEKAIEASPATAIYHFNWASAVVAEGKDVLAAAPGYEKAIELAPKETKYAFALARLYYDARKFKKAEKYYRRGLEYNSNNAEMWNMVGVCAFEQKAYKRAVYAYRIAAALDTSNIIYGWNLGTALYYVPHADDEMYEEAARHMLRAWEADPTNRDYILGLGNTYFQLHQYENATRCYDIGMKMLGNGEDPVYLNMKAVASVNDWNQKVSLKDHHHVVIHPNSGRYILQRERSYFWDMKLLKMIEESYEKAQKLNAQDAVYCLNLANLAFDQEDFEKALVWYKRAVEIAPKKAEYRNSLGLCLMELEKEEEAVEQFDFAILLDPKNVMHYFNRGRCLFKLKRFHEAAQAFEQAAMLEPDNANIQNWWGTSLVSHGFDELAAPMFNKAAAMDQHQHTYHIFFDGRLHSVGREWQPPPNYTSPLL